MLVQETTQGDKRVKIQTWTGTKVRDALLRWGRENDLVIGKTCRSEGELLRSYLQKKLGTGEEGVRSMDSTLRREGKVKASGKKKAKKASKKKAAKKSGKKRAAKKAAPAKTEAVAS